MSSKAENKFEWASIPIVNYWNLMDEQEGEDLLTTLKEMNAAWQAEGDVEFHKDRFGKQETTFTSGNRFWVWEGRDWRVFASNKAGTSFEVRAGIDVKRAWKALDAYRRKTGLQR